MSDYFKVCSFGRRVLVCKEKHSVLVRIILNTICSTCNRKHICKIVTVETFVHLECAAGLVETLCDHIRHLHSKLSMQALDFNKPQQQAKKKVPWIVMANFETLNYLYAYYTGLLIYVAKVCIYFTDAVIILKFYRSVVFYIFNLNLSPRILWYLSCC